jgi:hypothetical protein
MHNLANLAALTFYFALAPFVHNLGQVGPLDFLQGFAIIAIVAILLLGLARLFSPDFDRVSLIAIAALVYFFSHRECRMIVASLQDSLGIEWVYEKYFAAVYLLLAAVPFLLFSRWPRDLRSTSAIISAVVGALLVLPVWSYVNYQFQGQKVEHHAADILDRPEFVANPQTAQMTPDVIFMVFDRYANSHVLREQYAFDNEPFLQALEKRNFFVARDSRSNYLRTAHSLAATLNSNYINDLTETIGPKSHDYQPLFARIQSFTAAKFLQRRGYRFYHFGSYWGPTGQISIADKNVNISTLPDFLTILFDRSFLGLLDRTYPFFYAGRRAQCERVPYKFEALRKRLMADGPPIFAFAHFLVPHTPYVFDADGNCSENYIEQPTSYLEQLQYANKEILALLDDIRVRARRPTVVVIQADEGPYPREYMLNWEKFDWTKASEKQLRKKTAILNAVFFSDGDYQSVSSTMTPVNIFRIIFNKYFGTQLPILPDRTYVHRDEAHLYDFYEVTEKVKWPRD